MGCTQSSVTASNPKEDFNLRIPPNISLRNADNEIEECQELARQQDEDKVKLLLLGTGESGKSTIFKQFRILYGSEKTEDDLRMYGVIVRSNITTLVRKICALTKEMGHEVMLDQEAAEATMSNREDCCGMTVREAFDLLVENIVEYKNNAEILPATRMPIEQAGQDWVGESVWAGAIANREAKLFLKHVEAIRVLWQVRAYISYFNRRIFLIILLSLINKSLSTYFSPDFFFQFPITFLVKNNSRCMDEPRKG